MMKKLFLIVFIGIISFSISHSALAAGAFLYLSPSEGTFSVGSTFSVSIYVNTKGNEINAIELDLKFPPDILQVTAPTAGASFISEWITPPSYSNSGGTVSFKGGVPGGIVTSAGLISTITFRTKSAGIARIDFLDSSKVLLNDGKGTPVFAQIQGGVYKILIPLPEGPKITSSSHPDPEIWYSNSSPIFSWEEEEGVTDFSFSLSQNPLENPDNISEGDSTLKSYDIFSDGIWYFHLRAKKYDIWGKTSHFGVKIDTTPPQKFEPRITFNPNFVFFKAEDPYSGIDHYEISLVNLEETPTSAPFFIEGNSPFKIPSNAPGKYSIIIRAYDRAGNYQEIENEFQIVSSNISFVFGKGIQIRRIFFPWWSIYLVTFILVAGMICLIFYLLRGRGFKKGIKEIGEALREIKKIEERETEAQKIREKFEEEKQKLEEKLK